LHTDGEIFVVLRLHIEFTVVLINYANIWLPFNFGRCKSSFRVVAMFSEGLNNWLSLRSGRLQMWTCISFTVHIMLCKYYSSDASIKPRCLLSAVVAEIN